MTWSHCRGLPGKHGTFTQCCFNVGPASSTLAEQHWVNSPDCRGLSAGGAIVNCAEKTCRSQTLEAPDQPFKFWCRIYPPRGIFSKKPAEWGNFKLSKIIYYTWGKRVRAKSSKLQLNPQHHVQYFRKKIHWMRIFLKLSFDIYLDLLLNRIFYFFQFGMRIAAAILIPSWKKMILNECKRRFKHRFSLPVGRKVQARTNHSAMKKWQQRK